MIPEISHQHSLLESELQQNKICIYNVGGKEFAFSREAIKGIGSIGHNILTTMYSDRWGSGDRFIDVSPKIFEKWFAPYIRHHVLPDLKSFKDTQEKITALAAAKALELTEIQEHLSLPAYPKGAFGPEEYKEYWGIQVDDVPPVPKNYIEFLKDKKASKTHMLCLVAKGLSPSRIFES